MCNCFHGDRRHAWHFADPGLKYAEELFEFLLTTTEHLPLTTDTHYQVFNSQGCLTRECSSGLKAASNARSGVHTRRKECFLCPFVQESRQMAQPVLTRAFLQPAAIATTQRVTLTHLPSPFLLARNLSSKQIAPTDNLQPNFDVIIIMPCNSGDMVC